MACIGGGDLLCIFFSISTFVRCRCFVGPDNRYRFLGYFCGLCYYYLLIYMMAMDDCMVNLS